MGVLQITSAEGKVTAGMLIAVLAALATFLIFQGRPINHDTAWFLVAVDRWMNGAELYQTIIEVNPPINFYFTLPAYWLAQLSGLTPANAQFALTSLITGGVLAWSSMIVLANDRSGTPRHLVFILMLWAALVLPGLKHFVQRDHLLVLFLTPWALGLAFSDIGDRGWGGARRGAFAALGICLKPHFLVFPLCATLFLILRDRSLRPVFSAANLSIAATGTAYVAFVWLFHREYFEIIVPIGLLVYGDYGFSDQRVLWNIGPIQLTFLLLLMLEFFRRKHAPSGVGILASLILAGILSYFLQWTGYTYQTVPIRSFGLLLCGFVMLRCTFGPEVRSALICFLLFAGLEVSGGFYRAKSAETLAEALSQEHPIESMSIFSSHPSVGPIVALGLGAKWENRYPALWTVPGIVNAQAEGDCNRPENECRALSTLAVQTRQSVLDDLSAGDPDVIVFDKKSGYFDEPGFSYEMFLRQSDEIAHLLDGYTTRVSLDRFDILYRD